MSGVASTLVPSSDIGTAEVLDLMAVLSNASEIGLKWGEVGGALRVCSLLLGAGGALLGRLSGHLAAPWERGELLRAVPAACALGKSSGEVDAAMGKVPVLRTEQRDSFAIALTP